jgi:hypothetical protein
MTNEWYSIARDKGWHDSDELGPDGTPSARQRLAWVALILTEWKEESDAEDDTEIWTIPESGKPDGVLSETVDIWIRCADTLGACGEPIEGPTAEPSLDPTCEFVISRPRTWFLGLAAECTRTGDHSGYAAALRAVMKRCEHWYNQDISPSFEEALAIKTAYNRTRSHRHGGKLA